MKNLAIIGGGAAGLAAAVAAAKALRDEGWIVGGDAADGESSARVVVYEADERVGRSILATGNGRCNFSNSLVCPHAYRNGVYVIMCATVFESLVAEHGMAQDSGEDRSIGRGVLDFFEGIGLAWREEGEGRLYPYANKASSVLDVLRSACASLGVEERVSAQVESVDLPASVAPNPSRDRGNRFTLKMADGSFERADAVIVAVGGRIGRGMLPGEFPFIASRPVLGPLATDTRITKQLDNIRVRAVARLARGGRVLMSEDGEVLFRKYGLSGIAIFNLSREAEPGDAIEVDILPFLDECDVEAFASRRFDALANVHGLGLTCGMFLDGLVLPQVARVVLKSIGFDEDAFLDGGDALTIIRAFKNLSFEVAGIGDERQCQVHRGGLDVRSFSPYTMEALEAPCLFAAGEALDVDARCGGYNLHWAWTSGIVAGFSAAARLMGQDVRSFPAPSFAVEARGGEA